MMIAKLYNLTCIHFKKNYKKDGKTYIKTTTVAFVRRIMTTFSLYHYFLIFPHLKLTNRVKIFPSSGSQVSSLACNEIKSHHSTLTSEKVNGKINNTSHLCQRSEVIGQKHCPQNQRDRQRITASQRERHPQKSMGSGTRTGKLSLRWQADRGSGWTSLRVKSPRGMAS